MGSEQPALGARFTLVPPLAVKERPGLSSLKSRGAETANAHVFVWGWDQESGRGTWRDSDRVGMWGAMEEVGGMGQWIP